MTSNNNPRNLLRCAGMAGGGAAVAGLAASAIIAAGVVNSAHTSTSASSTSGTSSVSTDDDSGTVQKNSSNSGVSGLSVPQHKQAPVGGSHGS